MQISGLICVYGTLSKMIRKGFDTTLHHIIMNMVLSIAYSFSPLSFKGSEDGMNMCSRPEKLADLILYGQVIIVEASD